MPGIKREDEFFTMLKEIAAAVLDTAEEYARIIEDFPNTLSSIPHMKVLELNSDERVRAIMLKLHSSFITPLDREDISALALAMDDIVDAMHGVAMRLELFNLSDMRLEAKQIAALTVDATKAVQDMINSLPNYKSDDTIMERSIRIGDIEDQGDSVYQTALYRLFHEHERIAGKYAVTWLRIFDRMESCLDACDKSAGIVRDIIMKSA